MEEQYDLVNFQVSGVNIWQHLRLQIFSKITEQLGVLDKPHEFKVLDNKLTRVITLIKGSVFCNPFFNIEKVDSIIFDHPRSKNVDGEYVDIYTNYMVTDNVNNNVKFRVIERSFDRKHKRENKSYKSYIDFFILIGEIKARIFKRKLSTSEKVKINEIEKKIFNDYEIDIPLAEWFEFESNKFWVISKLLLFYFKLKSPEKIIVVVSYSLGYAIKAAKECGIKIIELQHGVISPYHMGYSYPDKTNEVVCFPDELWTWGSYWNTSSFFPIPQQNIIEHGSDYFNSQKKKYLNTSKIKNTILFISQGVLGARIVRFIDEILPLLDKKCRITLKLHPGEFDRFESYNKVESLQVHPNVTIVKECDLFSLLSSSEYQVGVFSTAIYEGLGFGCKTILLNMPGIEYMDRLLERKMAKLCDSPKSFRSVLASFGDEETELIEGYGETFFK